MATLCQPRNVINQLHDAIPVIYTAVPIPIGAANENKPTSIKPASSEKSELERHRRFLQVMGQLAAHTFAAGRRQLCI